VVILIIVVLAALLFPVLGGVREKGQRTICMSNQRQLALACSLYAAENGGQLPFTNSGGGSRNNPGWLPGWAYRTLTGNQTDVCSGAVWQYVRSTKIYHCPMDRGPWAASQPARNLSSYIMNSCMNGNNAVHSYRVSQFNASDILLWEADHLNFALGNDLAQYPDQGLDNRHAPGATIACIDGHTEWIALRHFQELVATNGRSRIWCNPNKSNGHLF